MQYPVRSGPLVNDAAAFSLEMAQGVHPDQPRPFRPPKLGWQTSQLTHDAAPFGPEMAAGWHADRPTLWLPLRTGTVAFTIDVAPFSVEMAQGSHPDRSRAFLAPRIALPDSQTTHTSAPFGPEMVVGWHPDRAMLLRTRTIPLPLSPTETIATVVVSGDNAPYSIDLPEIGATIVLGDGGQGGMT